MPSEVTPAHRRAAAEAINMLHPEDCAQWIETGTFAPIVTRTPAYEAGNFAVYSRVAQAIADAEARGRAEERARLLKDCTYLSYDPGCGFEEHDTAEQAKGAAEDALIHALDGDTGWNEGTEHISYGALVYFGRVVETSRRDATPEDADGFDEYVEYELKETDAPLDKELDNA